MNNLYSKKYAIVKRILCAFLAAIMVLTNMYTGNGSKVLAATPDVEPTTFGGEVMRGVVQEISDLPHSGEDNPNSDAPRGTAGHPFVILEIVGYYEQAEIGYLVGGCEPIRVDELFGTQFLKNQFVPSLKTALVQKTSTSDEVYFFADEKEGDLRYYENMTADNYNNRIVDDTQTVNVKGYWEYVGDAKEDSLFDNAGETRVGTHVMEADPTTHTVKMKYDLTNGNFAWHSVNDVELDNNRKAYAGIIFKDVLDISKMYLDGDRIYTTRSNKDENGTLVNMAGDEGYAYYKNKEILLTESLGLTEKEAIGYSVVVKTITSEDLNMNPEWVDYADLIYINPVSKNGAIAPAFKKQLTIQGRTEYVNSLGLTSTEFSASYANNIFETNDLDFSVVRSIFYKVSSEENFATLMMDSDLYNLGVDSNNGYYKDSIKNGLQVDVFDWNLNPVENIVYPDAGSEAAVAEAEQNEGVMLADLSMSDSITSLLAGATAGQTYTHTFSTSSDINTTGLFKINGGSIKTNRLSKTYNGVTYTTCYELASSASIGITSGDNGGTLTLVFGDVSKDVYIAVDAGATALQSLDASTQVLTMELAANTTYTFSKANLAYIYYMEYVENGGGAVPSPTPAPTATPAAASGLTHNFSIHELDTATFYVFNGSKNTTGVTLTVGELSFTKALKMESGTSIGFTAENTGTLTLITDKPNLRIKVDNEFKTIDKNGVVTVDLAAGSHTVTKGDSLNLCYISFEYGAIATPTAAPSLGGGHIHNFTLHDFNSSYYKFTSCNDKTGLNYTYGGLKFTKALNVESATLVEFGHATPAAKGTLTLITNGANKQIKIDGETYTTTTDGSLKVTLEAGSHKITKVDSIYIYYMSFEDGVIIPDAGTATPSPAPDGGGSSEESGGGSTGEGATSGTEIHNFTKNEKNSSFYTFAGDSLSTKYSTIYKYDGLNLELTKSLKLNSKGSISFTAKGDGALTLVFDDASIGKAIMINGNAFMIGSKSVTVNVKNGVKYTVTQKIGDESRVFFIAVEYGKQVDENVGGGNTEVKPVDPSADVLKVTAMGSNNNVYKLCMMLISCNPNLVRQIWFRNHYITTDGVNLLQTEGSDAATYWSGATFKLALSDMTNTTLKDTYYKHSPGATSFDLYDDWNSVESFRNYGWHETFTTLVNLHSYKAYVSNHVYAIDDNKNGGLGLAKYFGEDNVPTQADGDYFARFDEFVKDTYKDEDAVQIGEEAKAISSKTAKPSYALRYVLDLKANASTASTTLEVLDIEPSVSIDNKLRQQWELKPSYVYMLVPDFAGAVEIKHQTTAEFNAKAEDLNSNYDLIYFGTDYSGYQTKSGQMQCSAVSGTVNAAGVTTVNSKFTDFADNALDGKIYFSLGDKLTSTEWKMMDGEAGKKYVERDRSTQFLVDINGNQIASKELRFPGNDISDIKYEALKVYIGAGKPVVADKYLYYGDTDFVQSNCNVYKLVQNYKTLKDESTGVGFQHRGLYSISETELVNAAVLKNEVLIIYNEYPTLYDGTTASKTSASLKNSDVYLPVSDSTGRAYMHFDFTVYAKNYGYRIYVDQDRNGKFEDSEIIVIGNAQNSKPTTYTYPLALSMVGLVQWKLEVYSKANEDIHDVITGCSAVKLKAGASKQQIRVLQILPGNTDSEYNKDNPILDLENSALFKKYYNNLEHYDVDVVSITLNEFNNLFKNNTNKFDFDMSKPISIGDGSEFNPKLSALQEVERKKISGEKTLKDFNMIIVGFQDTYGEKDLNNADGAVEYLQYYTMSGKSILYTHDLTSLYNLKAQSSYNGDFNTNVFGSTANTLLRDLMGMNRYRALSNQLENRGMTIAQMIAFQNQVTHDDIDSNAKHGFTYWALKRYGYTEDYSTAINANERMPFEAMVRVPGTTQYITELNVGGETGDKKAWYDHIEKSGFNNSNEVTKTVKQMNEGQITEFPYKIDETLLVAETHAQSYQLNLEDPEVTVWYCLAGEEGGKTSTTNVSGNGTSVSYAANPMDGANNYYIYSKGNIFYSGVGHEKINDDAEAKLFVNTMIAAYRGINEAAAVEVLNPGVVEVSPTEYTLQIPRRYDNSTTAGQEYDIETFAGGTSQEVEFTPKNYNFRNIMDCSIYYAGTGEYVPSIYYYDDAGNKQTLTTTSIKMGSNTVQGFKNLKQGVEYYFNYPKSNLDAGKRRIEFSVTYDDGSLVGKTYLDMTIQPLFQLD